AKAFFSYLLSEHGAGKQVGRYDGRYLGDKMVNETGYGPSDPSDNEQSYAFVGAMNQYLRMDLGFDTDLTYVTAASIDSWPYSSDASQFASTYNLSRAFSDNRKLQVFVASGYYDMACPMGTVEYERARLDVTSGGLGR